MSRRTWSPAAEEKLRELYSTTALPRLAFLLKRTESAVKSRAKLLSLRRTGRKLWTAAELRQLKKRYPNENTAVIAKDMGRLISGVYQKATQLGLSKSDDFLASTLSGRVQRGKQNDAMRATQFKPGQAPANKGLRRPGWAPGRMAQTQFKQGRHASEARNYVPIGTEKFDAKRKVLMRKITDDPSIFPTSRWQPVHVLVWKAAGNEIPEGHICIFRPGMKTLVAAEITIDRLEVVSMAENMRRNSFLNRYPPEVIQLIRANASLKRSITCKERNRNEEQDGRRAKPPVRRTGKPGRPRKADGDRARQGNQ